MRLVSLSALGFLFFDIDSDEVVRGALDSAAGQSQTWPHVSAFLFALSITLSGVVRVDVDGSERLRIKLTKAADREEQGRKAKAQRRADRHRAMQEGEAARAQLQQQAQVHSVLLTRDKKSREAAAAEAAALEALYLSRDTPRHAKTRALSQHLQQQIIQVCPSPDSGTHLSLAPTPDPSLSYSRLSAALSGRQQARVEPRTPSGWGSSLNSELLSHRLKTP